jgi:hypothetical protein
VPKYFVHKKNSDSCCTVGEEMVLYKQLKTLSLYLAGSHSFFFLVTIKKAKGIRAVEDITAGRVG